MQAPFAGGKRDRKSQRHEALQDAGAVAGCRRRSLLTVNRCLDRPSLVSEP